MAEETKSIGEYQVDFRHRLLELWALVEKAKPNDRSEEDRHWAIIRTDIDKLVAYVHTFLGPMGP